MTSYPSLIPESQKWASIIAQSAEMHPLPKIPGFATKAIHEGQEAEAIHGSLNVPIYFSSTFKQPSPGVLTSKFDYGRAGNPTTDALNTCFAAIEEGKYGLTFSSGCAATSAIIMTMSAGDHIITIDDVYGGTNRMLNKIFKRFAIEVSMIDLTVENLLSEIKPNTKILWIESPTNPTMKITDIQAICKLAKSKGIITVVDSTFSSPYLQTPLLLGADMVMHSCTKYLSGHSDVIAGMMVTNDIELYKKVYFNLLSLGGCISPFDSYILLRSLKTLKVRMREHCKNGSAVAVYLLGHPKVAKVYYPGFKNHPNYEVAVKQMRHPGAMISFELKGDFDSARLFIKSLKVFILAESLGGVESLVESPALMTHMSVPIEQREKLGISNTLIRISVGIEEVEDLLDDLENALEMI